MQRFVKKHRHTEQNAGDGVMELEWAPGTGEVDFGQADALIAGERGTVQILVERFPYSNMRFVQTYRVKNALMR